MINNITKTSMPNSSTLNNKSMEKIDLIWSDLKILDDENINNIEDNIIGVYRLSYLSTTEMKAYVFYVGKSTDIKLWLKNHLLETEQNICIKNYISSKKCFFRYAKVNDDNNLDSIHRFLYKFYQPDCNDTVPNGEDTVAVNIS